MDSIKSLVGMLMMGVMLVSAQALWASVAKASGTFKGTAIHILSNLVASPRIWFGAVLYVIATSIYFFLLSNNRFFVVQISMTAIAIIFSCLLAYLVFHERITPINVLGILLVFAGLIMVIQK